MHRLIIGVASVNLILSAVVVYNVVSYNNETSYIIPEPIVIPKSNTEHPGEGIEDVNPETPELEEDENVVEQEPEKRKTLTSDELQTIVAGRNPFGSAPTVNASYEKQEADYQQKVDEIQKKYEEIAKEKELKEQLPNDDTNNVTPDVPVTTTPSESTSGIDKVGSIATDPVKVRLDKAEAVSIAKEKSKKYQIPAEWIIATIEETSGYQADLTETKNEVVRKGVMQIREDKTKFTMESLGRYYQASLVYNPTMNIEMGAWYLSYLSKLNSDRHYVFTAYYHGESYAKNLKASKGSYQTNFSEDILRKVANLKIE